MTPPHYQYRGTRPITPPKTPEQEMLDAGYRPTTPYPEKANAPWPSRCTTCGQPRRPSLTEIRGGVRCAHSGSSPYGTPEKEMLAAGYRPLVPYPGRVNLPWPSRCTTCGRYRAPTLSHLRYGLRCRHTKQSPAHLEEAHHAHP